jgi:hypothetical protein
MGDVAVLRWPATSLAVQPPAVRCRRMPDGAEIWPITSRPRRTRRTAPPPAVRAVAGRNLFPVPEDGRIAAARAAKDLALTSARRSASACLGLLGSALLFEHTYGGSACQSHTR